MTSTTATPRSVTYTEAALGGSKTINFAVSEIDSSYIIQATGQNVSPGALGIVTIKVSQYLRISRNRETGDGLWHMYKLDLP